MLQFRNILCPIDFSETSARALGYATALARWYDARLEVLHVVPAPEADDDRAGEDHRGSTGVMKRIQGTMVSSGADGLDATPRVETGRPNHVIARRAQEMPADLLVLGAHGRSGFNRLMLGSVTEKVLRQVTCPVLTVPLAAHPQADERVSFKTILCPIDYSPSSLLALQHALDLARQAGGCVTVLHALEYIDTAEPAELSPFDPCHDAVVESRGRRLQLVERARSQLHASVAPESREWCDIQESAVLVDRAYKAILKQADALHADLIVMGAQGASGLELMVYGSNTQHVLRAAACPVLTVKA
ncbi:MAG: universal stress protein [Vicinamibacterales bacterium]